MDPAKVTGQKNAGDPARPVGSQAVSGSPSFQKHTEEAWLLADTSDIPPSLIRLRHVAQIIYDVSLASIELDEARKFAMESYVHVAPLGFVTWEKRNSVETKCGKIRSRSAVLGIRRYVAACAAKRSFSQHGERRGLKDGVVSVAGKVLASTLGFWIIEILETTLGDQVAAPP
ncbi:hypothetical protein [Sphingomonas beigongshangi]|uniref:hypothetical protein n=1 Tax=Sphingomonas beigongshangi TaxID=2782540 RepID=UPI001FF01917|nr:hypothetical protein [Sphingomonas beigongshangi]